MICDFGEDVLGYGVCFFLFIGDDYIYFYRVLWGLSEVMFVEYLWSFWYIISF